MSVWSPLSILPLISPSRRAVAKMSRRWTAAIARDEELLADLVRLGGLLEGELHQPVIGEGGMTGEYELIPPDPIAMAIRTGRRQLAQQLMALATVDADTLAKMMENSDAHS